MSAIHRASSSAFAWGRQIHTKYKTGCLRRILMASRTPAPDIHPKYVLVGKLNEDRHAARTAGWFIREQRFERELSHGVTLAGHADFVHYDVYTGKPDSVDELKSVQSKTTRRDVIRNGVWITENLAQLVCYMTLAEVVNGRLIYSFYEPVDDGVGEDGKPKVKYVCTEERFFAVAIDDFGRIHVDSNPTKYTIHDLYAHQVQAAEAIATGKLADRPLGWDTVFGSPCGYCPYAAACDAHDSGLIEGTDAFVAMAMTPVEGSPE